MQLSFIRACASPVAGDQRGVQCSVFSVPNYTATCGQEEGGD